MRKTFYLLCALTILGHMSVFADEINASSTKGNRTYVDSIDDQRLKGKISSTLNKTYPDNNIEVTSYSKTILLTGQVKNAAIKQKVASTAKQQADVKNVLNFLTIGRKQSIAQTSKDSWITTKVKSKLMTINGIDSGAIKIVTTNGIVYLLSTNSVSNEAKKVIVDNIFAISGVKKVATFFPI